MSIDDDVVHSHGLDVREDVLQLYTSREITALQAILLAHVDYFCCPFEEEGMVKSKRFTIRTLRKILQCSTKTVGRAITDLNDRFHSKLFRARKISKTVWELRTRQRRAARLFYIYPDLRKLFEEGRFTPTELLVMATIAGFTRNGRYCWLSDRQIGKRLGLKIEGVRWHLKELRRKNELVERIMTHDEAREWLQRIEYGKPFRRRGKRTTRFLFPMREELRGNVEGELVAVKLPVTEPKQKAHNGNGDEIESSAVKLLATEPKQKAHGKCDGKKTEKKAVAPRPQFKTLRICLQKKPYLAVVPADEGVVLANSTQILNMTIDRPGCVLVLNVLKELFHFVNHVGANDRTFDLKEIAAIMGVKYNACFHYVRNGYLVPSVRRATAPGKYCQHLFDWTDAFAAGIIGTAMRAGILLKVGCKVQPLLRRQLQLPEREEAPAQA